jgi:hypothetical protein
MEFIQPIADLLGISPLLLIALALLFLLLVGAWYVLKFILKLAWKVMLPGCLLIILVLGGLYVAGVLLAQ